MTDLLDVEPQTEKIKTGVIKVSPLAKALAECLADTYRLVFKTHAYHWNVEGPLFYPLHKLTEAQYEDIEAHLGRAKLAQLYALLDELIDLQGDDPQEETSDMTDTETTTTLIDAAA